VIATEGFESFDAEESRARGARLRDLSSSESDSRQLPTVRSLSLVCVSPKGECKLRRWHGGYPREHYCGRWPAQRSAHGFVSRGNLSPVPDGQRPYE
jgi:hypothetical protein